MAPWQMAQSYPHIFLAWACDSAVGFTGFTIRAASAGITVGPAGCCDASKKGMRANRTKTAFSISGHLDRRRHPMPQPAPMGSIIFARPNFDIPMYAKGTLLLTAALSRTL